MPTTIASADFQAQQGFIAALTPKLARALPGAISPALLAFVKIVHLPRHRFGGGSDGESGPRRCHI